MFRLLLHPFQFTRLSSIAHIYIYINEFRHIYVSRFINIYMNVDNVRNSYNLKRKTEVVPFFLRKSC